MSTISRPGKSPANKPVPNQSELRKKRLAESLKANLKRRKKQSRQRNIADPVDTSVHVGDNTSEEQ